MDHSDGIDQARYSFQHANLYKTNQQCCYFLAERKREEDGNGKIKSELSLQDRCCTEGHRTSPRCTETWHCHGPHWLSRWFSYHALAIASTKIIRIHQIEIKTLLLLQSISLHFLSFLQNVVQVKCNTLMSLDWEACKTPSTAFTSGPLIWSRR